MRALLTIVIVHVGCLLGTAQEKRELSTRITEVTVFNSGAQVHRKGTLTVGPGKTIIQINGITPDLDPKSIQVRASEPVSILTVAHEWNTSPTAFNNSKLDSLQGVLNSLERHLQYLTMRQDVLNKKMGLLSANERLAGETASVNMDQLEEALVLFESVYMKSSQESLEIKHQIDSIHLLQSSIFQKMSEIRGTPLVSKSEIEVLVQSEQSTPVEIDLSYIVKNAGWTPRYDIRANDISQPIALVYKAEVRQQTGEKWENVSLGFSNASPYARQSAPELEPWRLTTLSKTTFRRIGTADLTYGTRVVYGRVIDENGEPLIYANVSIPGRAINVQTDLNGDFTIITPSDASMLNISYTGYETQNIAIAGEYMNVQMKSGVLLESVQVVGRRKNATNYYIDGIQVQNTALPQDQLTVVVKNQVSVSFQLDYPVTVLSDGKNVSYEMQTYTIDAQYHYEVVPKVDPGAYLVATLTDWEQYHLMEGQANLYFKNTFIGRTLLDPLSLNDTLEIALGRDPDMLTERKTEEVISKKSLLGGSTLINKTYKITLRNTKSTAVHLQVLDQVPVSVNDAVVINVKEWSGGQYEPLTGMVKWELELAPASSQTLRLAYEVKHPSKEKVILD